jgi:hypothetical protein
MRALEWVIEMSVGAAASWLPPTSKVKGVWLLD